MRKFAVFSGFLGSGKTTAMIALVKYYSGQYGRAAMVVNDLGSDGLADYRLAKFARCEASELTGECICYQTENLVERLNSYYDQGVELVISDIPGFGVGALNHVYHTLEEQYGGSFDLAPFTVLVEPERLEALESKSDPDLWYLLHTQLVEADLILLNKCDLIPVESRAEMMTYLQEQYPQAKVLGISAQTGEGIPELALALRDGKASMQQPEIGYGGDAFSAAMSRVSEWNMGYYAVVCCKDFDGDQYLLDLAKGVQEEVGRMNQEIPHLKILAWTQEGIYGKVDLLGTDRPIEVNHRFDQPCTELAVVLNSTALCPGDLLDRGITQVVEVLSREYQLTLYIHGKDQK